MDPRTLVRNPKNPRRNDAAVPGVARSIQENGFGAPIVARLANRMIIAGDTRWRASVEVLELPLVPVRFLDVTQKQAEVLTVGDNKLGELAEWDDQKLADLLQEMEPAEQLLAGFGPDDIGDLLAELEGEPDVVEDEVPEPPKVPVTQSGDVWILGRHRLVCGDSRLAETHALLMNGSQLGLIVTDPPYGVAYADKNAWLNEYDEGNRVQTPIENDHGTVEDTANGLWKPVFQALHDVAAPGCVVYSFAPQGGDQMMMMMMMHPVFPVRHELIWVKNNHVLGRADYQYKHEPILYAWKRGGHKFYGGFQTSLLEYSRPQKSDLHPTMKPVALVAKLLENSSTNDDLVGDPFLGSGTTLIAAEQLGRTCFGIELSPAYCDVVVQRWEQLTGGKAQRA